MAYYDGSWNYETDYPDYKMSYGGYQPQPAPSLAKTATDAATKTATDGALLTVPGASLALGALGTGLSAYGAYKQGEVAEDALDLQREQFEFEKDLSVDDRIKAEIERRRRAALEGGQYATNALDKGISRYGAYNAMTGR